MVEAVDPLSQTRAWVDAFLRRFLAEKRRTAPPEVADLVEAAALLTLRGGKRFRPALAVAGYRAVTGEGSLQAVAEAAAALELLQTYLLIQDDWMDRDDLRRGGPAVHAWLRGRGQPEHAAASVAILASDLSATWALEVLTAAPFDPARIRSALTAYHWMVEEVVLGQYLDVTGSKEIDLVHLYKTAGYTVRWPVRIGALLGGGAPEAVGALDRFAKPVGLAFQLRDDLLGTFGDPAVTGKPSGNDLLAGKRTALIAEAEARLALSDRGPIDQVFGRTQAGEAAIAAARALLEASGAKAAVERRIEQAIAEGEAALEGAPIEQEGRARLLALGRMIAARSA